MKNQYAALGAALIAATGIAGAAAGDRNTEGHALVVTASNTPVNQLLVYDTTGTLLKRIPTQGQGGVGGNSGGISQSRDRLAVVNFGSGTVSVFAKDHDTLRLEHVIQAVASPLSVVFGDEHLYILSTTHVESHVIGRNGVESSADGVVPLVHADGSAAQVGKLPGELIISEKSNVIESVKLSTEGAVMGAAAVVSNLPVDVNAPFGLVTRGNDAYVSIAHSNEVSLVRRDALLTVASSGTQSAPCWLALDGPFLFSTNSPSHSVSRFAVYGRVILQDAAVAATFDGNPTDIDARSGMAAVVDANGTVSHVSVFKVDEDGHMSLTGVATIKGAATNGVVIVGRDGDYER
jgi:hypothetical protein